MVRRFEQTGGEPGDPTGVTSPALPGVVGRLRNVWSNPAYRFAFLFLTYLGVGATAYPIISRRYFFLVENMMEMTAAVEHSILKLFADDVGLSGTMVGFSTFPLRIIEECTGLYEFIIFASLVLAFPTTAAKKAIGLSLGIPLIYLFNVVRILVLILVGHYYYRAFEFMHLYFWQVTLILMVTAVWLLWIFKVVRYEESVGSTA
jgi:archaeosortase B (VPXXXP-CTERM-specific)